MWKYFDLLPLRSRRNVVSLGEGGTSLISSNRLAARLGVKKLRLKNDTTNPTGSHKDRQISVTISKAKELGRSKVSTASSGNVGASVAAYSARAGFICIVLVPSIASPEKLVQIKMYGANVIRVETESNIAVAEILKSIADEFGLFNIVTAGSHNPYTLEGGRTIAFEIFEQYNRNLPDTIITPVGGGGLVGSLWTGLKDLVQLGLVDGLPRIIGVQARGCAPFVEAIRKQLSAEEALKSPWSGRIETICEAIADTIPLDARTAIPAITESKGTAIAVPDTDILKAQRELAALEGIFAEPSSCTVIAALNDLLNDGTLKRYEEILCVITGSGLKSIKKISKLLPESRMAKPSLDSVSKVVRETLLHRL